MSEKNPRCHAEPTDKVKRRNLKLAIREKEAFRSSEELKCPFHPQAKFIKSDRIDKSQDYVGRELWDYGCEECLELSKKRISEGPSSKAAEEYRALWEELRKRTREKHSYSDYNMAYECPFCGFVKGSFHSESYGDWEDEKDTELKGFHFLCRVCGTQIGGYYWKRKKKNECRVSQGELPTYPVGTPLWKIMELIDSD